MQRIRYLDKLVDELARGKEMEKVLRSEESLPDVSIGGSPFVCRVRGSERRPLAEGADR